MDQAHTRGNSQWTRNQVAHILQAPCYVYMPHNEYECFSVYESRLLRLRMSRSVKRFSWHIHVPLDGARNRFPHTPRAQ